MTDLSRRQLARFAVTQLLSGRSAQDLSMRLTAALVFAKKQKETDLLIDDIYHELETRGMLAYAQVTSARKLTVELRRNLISQIEKTAKVDNVVLNEKIDKDIIGGLKIETAKHSWDKTVMRRLTDIKGGI